METRVRILEVGFKKEIDGLIREIVHREGDVVLLAVYGTHGRVTGCEVHQLRVLSKDYKTLLAGSEVLSGREHFGTYGFSYATKEHAIIKLNELFNRPRGCKA